MFWSDMFAHQYIPNVFPYTIYTYHRQINHAEHHMLHGKPFGQLYDEEPLYDRHGKNWKSYSKYIEENEPTLNKNQLYKPNFLLCI